jgi:hypothetical protein
MEKGEYFFLFGRIIWCIYGNEKLMWAKWAVTHGNGLLGLILVVPEGISN